MRHAISIAAAASGTVLLALGLFGEPASYLREARTGWQSPPSTNDVAPSDAPPAYAPPADTKLAENTAPPDTTLQNVTPPNVTPPGLTSSNVTPPNPAPSSPTSSPPAPSTPTPSNPAASNPPPPAADRRNVADTATKARMEALQSEVAKLREALAERGQGGTGDVPDKRDTDRQRGGADSTTHRETANPPPAAPSPDKAKLDEPPPVAPRTVPQAVERALPPTPPPAAATPPAPAPEPQVVERAPPKAAPASPPAEARPDTRVATRAEPPKAALEPTPRVAERSEPPPIPTEHVSPQESASRASRRVQSAERSDGRDTAARRSDKPAPRTAAVTPPTPPAPPPAAPQRSAPPPGNPPLQAALPLPVAPQRRDAGRPPPSGDDQDTDAVLARLRQSMQGSPGAPTPQAMQLADASQAQGRPIEPASGSRGSNSTGPIVGRLRAARNDLMAGRIEAARRQLQQAQLSLVFRPVGEESNADAITSGAASVGRALSALGQNDVRASLGFVDRATADLQHGGGGNGQPPLPQSEVAGGYAPAYPPR